MPVRLSDPIITSYDVNGTGGVPPSSARGEQAIAHSHFGHDSEPAAHMEWLEVVAYEGPMFPLAQASAPQAPDLAGYDAHTDSFVFDDAGLWF